MRRTPPRPSASDDHRAAGPTPRGLITPNPVITTRRSERSMGNSSVSTGAGGDRGAGLGALFQVGLPLTASGSARLPASRGRPGPLIRPPQGLLARLSVDFRGVSDFPRTALGSRQVEN